MKIMADKLQWQISPIEHVNNMHAFYELFEQAIKQIIDTILMNNASELKRIFRKKLWLCFKL